MLLGIISYLGKDFIYIYICGFFICKPFLYIKDIDNFYISFGYAKT